MATLRAATGKVLQKLRAAGTVTIAELTLLLNCSVRTAHRRLWSWGAIHSYNGNGRFYTVPQVVQFDENGLWRCRGAYFSRHGNLTETVVGLVSASSAGLTAAELGELLGLNAHSFISQLGTRPPLRRERIGGRYVYFAAAPGVRQKQHDARRLLEPESQPALPSDAEAVLIFAEMIRHPHLEPEQISARLRTGGTAVEPRRIQRLIEHHGLAKKGAPDSASCLP
ncbi:MAG: hypothetical protein QG597_5145 [Actinomycetota bacterium]|nr:hypothetical protein [Actinomycetota bacterium]